jgi:hypothetical protein
MQHYSLWIWKPHNAELEDCKIAASPNFLEKHVMKTYHDVIVDGSDYPIYRVFSTITAEEIGVIGEVEVLR